MAITTNCPHCSSTFRLPESQAGKRVRCRSCSETFLVPDNQVPVLEEEVDEIEDLPVLEETVPNRRRSETRLREEPKKEEKRPVRRRRTMADIDDDDADDYEKPTSGGSPVVLIAVGILGVLLIIGGGLIWYFASSESPPSNPQASLTPVETPQQKDPEINPPIILPQDKDKDKEKEKPPVVIIPMPAGPPTDLATALAAVRDTSADRKREGLNWLLRNEPVAAKREEVSTIVATLLGDAMLRRDAVRVLVRWDGQAETSKLTPLLSDLRSEVWQPAIALLAKQDDADSIDALTKQLTTLGRTSDAAKALRQIGKKAEPSVVKLMHHSDANIRSEVAKLLASYETPAEAMLDQSIVTLEGSEPASQRSALAWLAKA